MSRQNDGYELEDFFIFDPDDPEMSQKAVKEDTQSEVDNEATNAPTSSESSHKHISRKRAPVQVDDIVIEDSDSFELDWNSIEDNMRDSMLSRRKRHKHRRSRRHSSVHSENGTKLRHTVHVDESKHKKKKKKKRILKVLLIIFLIIALIALALLITFVILRDQGKRALFNYDNINITTIDNAEAIDNGQTIIYNDVTYTFNPYVTSILFMGVDKEQLELEDNIVGTGGQADAIYLLTYNASNGKMRVLSFSRDTMTDINTYTTTGEYAGVENAQLCLAYAYGDGKKKSAENVVSALSRKIYNIPINSYLAMDLEAIGIVNDDIGGVTLTSLFTHGDFVEGQSITILGDNAEVYVRTRDVSVLDSNVGRMARQQQYLNAFTNQLIPSVKRDLTVAVDLYNHASEYVVTNLDTSRITYLASSIASSYNGIEFVSIPGTITASEKDGKAQFTVDEIKLYEILLDTFYTVTE